MGQFGADAPRRIILLWQSVREGAIYEFPVRCLGSAVRQSREQLRHAVRRVGLLKQSYRPELASWFESLVVTKEFDSDDGPQVILSGNEILVEIGAMLRMKSA